MGKIKIAFRIFLAAFAVAGLAACNGKGLLNGRLFKERAAESPAPHEEGIEKTFFRNADGTPKNFLCAWSPEIGRGFLGERILHRLVNEAMHCNLQWDITEHYLVGKMVDPSYPNNPELWKTILQIGITKHYYFEREKDDHGRETNNWIENDTRSHFSARPYIKLNLADIQVLQFTGTEFGSGSKITSVEEIEWDRPNNFLGFSANVVFPAPSWMMDEYQAKLRFNFMKFDHDESFTKIPFNEENSRMMNILHVMGNKVGGTEQKLYAAHWDFRNSHDLYISGANPTVQKILLDAVGRWNTALQNLGVVPKGQLAFNPIVKDLKHPFDLRYSTINWISEKRISMNSPLGIGMAHADLRNGKILWGGVVLYGGMLETYINRYAPTESSGGATTASQLSPLSAFANLIPNDFIPMTSLDDLSLTSAKSLEETFQSQHQFLGMQELAETLKQPMPSEPDQLKELQDQIEAMRDQMGTVKSQTGNLTKMVGNWIREAKDDQKQIPRYFQSQNFRDFVLDKDENPSQVTDSEKAELDPKAAALEAATGEKRDQLMDSFATGQSPFFLEEGRSVENMAAQWKSASAQTTRTYPDMLESVVMDLTLHEVGHMIGLGHQFKENILPKRGTVPNKYVNDLTKLATADKQFTNYTSVMGYRNGRVEMELPADQLQPGPHDLLVLRYLYLGKYTSYDKANDAWVYTDVPISGKIPSRSNVPDAKGVVRNLPTSYFPACNDLEASYDEDPYCNRWDRGSSAEDITRSYFELISDNLLSSLYSLVGGGGDHFAQEYRLWMNALGTFSRTRLFYDEMRRRMRSDQKLLAAWDELRSDTKTLFEFSTTCQSDNPLATKSKALKTLFSDPDILDLCRANALALNEYRFFLNLPESDYTRIDHTNRYVSGGYLAGDVTRNYGHIMGSWFQLSNFPLKYAAMFTLTTANAYQMRGPYLARNMFYNNEEDRSLYRTLYPREYTQLISDAVINNLRFAATGLDRRTGIGKTILAASGLMPGQRYTSNDAALLPPSYNDMLDQQTQFQISMVGIVITAQQPDVNSNVKAEHYKKFTASMYDPYTDRQTTAREVFVLPRGDVMVWANGMFLYPITKLKFFAKQTGYVIAYKVTYDHEVGDKLIQDSVKSALLEKHNDIAKVCVDGFKRNGLASFFNESQPEFEGFYIPDGIAEEVGKERTLSFYDSIDKQFDIYLNGPLDPADEKGEKRLHPGVNEEIPASFPLRSMTAICDESKRGIGQVSATAALMNGIWLRITPDYLVK